MNLAFIFLIASHSNGAVFLKTFFFAFMVRKPFRCLALCALLSSPFASLYAQGLALRSQTEKPLSFQTEVQGREDDPLPARQDFFSGQPDYRIRWAVDAPVVAAGTAWTLWAFGQVYGKDSSTLAQIQALRKEDVNGFDRWAAGKNSSQAAKVSDLFFYGVIPAPLIVFGLDPKIRKDFWKVGLLYWETMAIAGTLYTGATYFVDRYRPETYDFAKPAGERVSGNYKNAFFAGHVANVGAISFFTAKIFHDYHPNSPWRWAFWGGAAAATTATLVLRHEAGKHWPSDLLLGALVGAGAGILVPQLHKNVRPDGTGFRVAPYTGPGTGVSIAYGF